LRKGAQYSLILKGWTARILRIQHRKNDDTDWGSQLPEIYWSFLYSKEPRP
jgi:hypothetical protein